MGIFNMLELQKSEEPVETTVTKPIEAAIINDHETVIKNGKDKLIKLNGSLSEVYTQALNEVYASENMGAMFNIINSIEDSTEIKQDQEDLYVHIVDNDQLEQADPLAITDDLRLALDKRKEHKKIVVMESDSLKSKIIMEVLKSKGIDCIQGRNTALETIKNQIF